MVFQSAKEENSGEMQKVVHDNIVKEKGLVSVIIPTYNSSEFIAQSIDSAVAQTYPDKEIIVIDDGSTDDTKEEIKPYREKILYYLKRNGGPASARNYGLNRSSGEFVAFLDADDIWNIEKLDIQIKQFKAYPNLDAVFCIADDGRGGISKYSSQTRKRMKDGYIFNELLKKNFLVTSTVMLRSKIFEDIGLFDEDKHLISVEDINLWLRISRVYRFGFVDKVLVKRRLHKDSFTEDFERMFAADIYNYRKLSYSYPEWQLQENKNYFLGLSNYFYECGDSYFFGGEYQKARKLLLRSLQYNIINFNTLLRYSLTLLPASSLQFLREKKKFLRQLVIP